jgi:hypothetical protein
MRQMIATKVVSASTQKLLFRRDGDRLSWKGIAKAILPTKKKPPKEKPVGLPVGFGR